MPLVATESSRIGPCSLRLVTAESVASTSLSPSSHAPHVASTGSRPVARHAMRLCPLPSKFAAPCHENGRGVPLSAWTRPSAATDATPSSRSLSSASPSARQTLQMPCIAANASNARLPMRGAGTTRTQSVPTRTGDATISKRPMASPSPATTRCDSSRQAYARSAAKTNLTSTAGTAASSGFRWITATQPVSSVGCCANGATAQSGCLTTIPSCCARQSATCSAHGKEQFVKEGSSH